MPDRLDFGWACKDVKRKEIRIGKRYINLMKRGEHIATSPSIVK
jgi:hypothetical protein